MFDPAASAVTVTRVSTNVLDMSVARDMGIGDGTPEPTILVLTDGLFAAAGASTPDHLDPGSTDNATFYDIALSPALLDPRSSTMRGRFVSAREAAEAPRPNATPRYYRMKTTPSRPVRSPWPAPLRSPDIGRDLI